MDLAVGALVAVVAGAFVVGVGVGVGAVVGWRRRFPAAPPASTIITPSAPTEAAGELDHLRAELARAHDELERLRSSADGAAGSTTAAGTPQRSTTAAAEPDLRRRFADIIGLESELASLRAVAARVPALERRIVELESGSPGGDGGSVIDLTRRAHEHP